MCSASACGTGTLGSCDAFASAIDRIRQAANREVVALGIRLYVIVGRRSYPSFTVAFSADGEGMDHASRSWPERGYPDKALN